MGSYIKNTVFLMVFIEFGRVIINIWVVLLKNINYLKVFSKMVCLFKIYNFHYDFFLNSLKKNIKRMK